MPSKKKALKQKSMPPVSAGVSNMSVPPALAGGFSTNDKAQSTKHKRTTDNGQRTTDKNRFIILLCVAFFFGTTATLARLNLLPSSLMPSFLSSAPLPDPTPTPPLLSKEYIYAGSRLLAVEDANAQQPSATDLAVYRKSSGQWWVMNGVSGGITSGSWGVEEDIASPADFDGDSKSDFCVFRPSNQSWYILNSSNSTASYYTFGLSTDKPVPSDYDG
jgi:hypothetical protein